MKPQADILEAPPATKPSDVQTVRADFPILRTTSNGKPLVYLDNGATTQKPQAVIDRIVRYYTHENANIHRGVYKLSQDATTAYEDGRKTVARFINASCPEEVIFTRGTTEAINLVASSWGRANLKTGDEVIVSGMEHHSGIVPWQLACEATGATLRAIPMNDAGELLLDEFEAMLSERTKIVSLVHVSNSLGTINDIPRIVRAAHKVGSLVLVDGAQWVAHYPTDVRALDVDFYAFSGHKLYGPTGIGVLYGKRALLEAMPPYQGGGDMIESVTFAKTTYAQLPNKLEAGTPHIEGVVGLAAAIDYVQSVGFDNIVAHEKDLLAYAHRRIAEVPGVRVIGTAKNKADIVSFLVEDPPISIMDVGLRLDAEGIAVRTGHHCCQPVMDRFGIPGTTRASFAMYNTRGDIDALVEALKRIVREAGARRSAKPRAKTTASSSVTGAAGGSSDGVQWARPFASSPTEAAEKLASFFEAFPEREEKNQRVLEFGEKLPNTFDLLKKIVPRVPGCMSEVYLVSRRSPERPDALDFLADANADIVRGLIAILQRLFSGQDAKQIVAFDIEGFFNRIGLDQFISSQRRNGLNGMVQRIKSDAAKLIATGDGQPKP